MKKNKKEAIAILEERIKIFLHPELIEIEPGIIAPKTLFEAIKEFKNTSTNIRILHLNAVSQFWGALYALH